MKRSSVIIVVLVILYSCTVENEDRRALVNDQVSDIHFTTFSVWFFWGIGLASHWLHVFGKNVFFSKNWEEKKIREFMEKDKFDN